MPQEKQQQAERPDGDKRLGPDKWFEFVRSLRTYYDHFRVAFPNLEQIPKYYSDSWGKEFRVSAKQFVRSEDMDGIREALDCVGYGTEKWERFRSADADALGRAIDDLLDQPVSSTGTVAAPGEEPTDSVGEEDGGADTARKETHAARTLLQERDRELKTFQDQLRRANEQEAPKSGSSSAAERGAQAPSEMGAKLKECEQTIAANEKLIESLKERTGAIQQENEELKESLQREKQARHQFEAELEKEREDLREHIRRLGDVLEGGAEIPALEELEQMEPDELLNYIEDVEQERQSAMASIEAMDAQEKGYQKQLEVQHEEMENIQDDLERYRTTNLAEEIGNPAGDADQATEPAGDAPWVFQEPEGPE